MANTSHWWPQLCLEIGETIEEFLEYLTHLINLSDMALWETNICDYCWSFVKFLLETEKIYIYIYTAYIYWLLNSRSHLHSTPSSMQTLCGALMYQDMYTRLPNNCTHMQKIEMNMSNQCTMHKLQSEYIHALSSPAPALRAYRPKTHLKIY